MNNHIKIIPSKNIDREKWDECVHSSPNGMIYALSNYLSQMADNWSGIVLGDYEVVLPIPWRKKIGIRYAYDVPFIQQLGWFAKNDHINTAELLEQLFTFVKYGSYSFNHGNALPVIGTKKQNNYTINLFAPYKSIAEEYKNDAVNNLKRAAGFHLCYQPCKYETALQMYVSAYKNRFSHTNEQDYLNFGSLCNSMHKQKMALARMVVDDNNGTVLATALFFKDRRRLYNLMNTTTAEGRKKSANHFLLDAVFKEFAGTGLLFDFEGSDIPGIMLFYEKFGAVNQPYPRLEKFNRLPLPVKWLKR